MSELTAALVIWLPLGTIVPLILARITGADWRGAFIEAAIFATLGIIIFPITIALIVSSFTTEPNVNVIFAASYVLALVCLILFRRHSNRGEPYVR